MQIKKKTLHQKGYQNQHNITNGDGGGGLKVELKTHPIGRGRRIIFLEGYFTPSLNKCLLKGHVMQKAPAILSRTKATNPTTGGLPGSPQSKEGGRSFLSARTRTVSRGERKGVLDFLPQ